MSPVKPFWKARYKHGALHISGSATKYPNDFSTASLARQPDDSSFPDLLIYHVIFHRDKEPYCDTTLIGPVDYFERSVPAGKTRVRVVAAEGTFDFPISNRAA